MINIKKMLAGTLVGIIALSAAGCSMISKTESAIKKSVVAKFDKQTITRGELDERMAPIVNQMKEQAGENFEKNSQMKEQLVEARKQMLDELITEKIELQKAKEKKLDADKAKIDEETEKKYNEIKTQYADKFEETLKSSGLTDKYFRELLRTQVILDKLKEDITKSAVVSDTQALNYYTQHPYEYTEQPNMITFAHITVATKDEANKVKERLDKGEAFDKVAKEVSIDTETKDKGGNVGEAAYTSFDVNFMKTVDKLKIGEISSPIQTQEGFQIVKVSNKKTYPLKGYEKTAEDIKKTLLPQAKEEIYNAQLKKWRDEAKIETAKYEKNLK